MLAFLTSRLGLVEHPPSKSDDGALSARDASGGCDASSRSSLVRSGSRECGLEGKDVEGELMRDGFRGSQV
jgi:hypothetical protein